MRRPNPPFLGLNFYFADLAEADAFARLTTALVELGATFTGQGYAHLGIGIQEKLFADITDEVLELLRIKDIASFTQALGDPNIRLLQVAMLEATGTVRNVGEILTYLSVSSYAVGSDHHPLAIWTDGELFSGTLRERYAKRAWEAGRKIHQRFYELVETLRPMYAAITIEEPLECPTDLRRDPRSYAFRDFFVSGTQLDVSKFIRIQKLFSGAYIELVGDGVYISCTREFNPEGTEIDIGYALKQSTEVAKLLGSSGLKK